MIGIDVPLLYILVIRFVELFSTKTSVYLYTLPHQQLVFWFFSFVVLGLYAWLSLARPRGFSNRLKIVLISTLGVFLVGSLLGIQVAARRATNPTLYIHDGAVETEDAISALKAGENPYQIDYRNRLFGAFPDVFSEATRPNPAWDHYIYLPFPIVLGLPLSVFAEHTVGWFDLRSLHVLFYVVLLMAGVSLAKDSSKKSVILMLLLFNPLFTHYFVAGFNDVIFLGLIALCALLLDRGNILLSSIALGLAVATKQSSWLLVPFYAMYVYFVNGQNMRACLKKLWPGLFVALLFILPFFLWSPGDFIDDTIRYASGSAALSYPISGFGLGQLMLSSGIIRSMWDSYPFWIIQAVCCLPLLYLLFRWLKNGPTISRMLTAYGVFAFVFWWTSRFFNDSYLGVISVILLLAFAAHKNKEVI